MYIYQHRDWPDFTWSSAQLSSLLARVRFAQGELLGMMAAYGFDVREDIDWKTVSEDVLKSSAIEGEELPEAAVRSSVARRLGLDKGGLLNASRDVEGMVEMMLNATHNADAPLNDERLFSWHAAMFPTGYSGMAKITVGHWRAHGEDDPMQVVSGAMGKERVHFQAPPARVIPSMMEQFTAWINDESSIDPILKAGIAHLWFLTIHPFDDGNGRISRAITDLLLARADNSTQRFYSMSSAILQHRKQYYQLLERSQKGSLDVTPWLEWFLLTLELAIAQSRASLGKTLEATRFWQKHQRTSLNERQRKIVLRLQGDFVGNLTSSKYAKITKVSQDTAGRDIKDLIQKGILREGPAKGRSTYYLLISDTE